MPARKWRDKDDLYDHSRPELTDAQRAAADAAPKPVKKAPAGPRLG